MLPELFTRGEFLDGLVYASVSRNLAEGTGSYWLPHYTQALYPEFTEHPPFFFWLESFWFRLLGDHHYTEKLFSLLCFAISALVIRRLAERAGQGTGWFAAILWTCIPVVFWAYRNNLLEVLLTPLILFSHAVLQQRYTRVAKGWQLPLIALLFMAAFLTKGPVALGILVLPLCFAQKGRWKNTIIDTGAAMLAGALLLLGLVQFSEGAALNLGRWFDNQFVATLSGARVIEHAENRFQLIFDFLQQMIIPLALWLLTWLLARQRPRLRHVSPDAFWASLLFSLPMLLSPKQHDYYLLPALAFAALYLGSTLEKPLHRLYEAMTKPLWQKTVAIFSVSVIAGIIVYTAVAAGTYHRDEVMQQDLRAIVAIVPGNVVGITYGLKFNWSLHAYAMRDHHLSLPDQGENPWLIAEEAMLPGYTRVSDSTTRFHLFRKDGASPDVQE